MSNAFVALLGLLPKYPLQVGIVSAVESTSYDVELPGGNTIRARGHATVGDHVFVRNGLIEGPAPALGTTAITI